MYSTQRSSSPRFATLDLARWTVPLVAWAAIRSLVVVQGDPAAQAETRFLAFWVAAVLMALAGLTAWPGRSRSGELLWTAVFATTVAWVAPPAPLRGALVGLVLALGLVVAAGRTWLDSRGRCTTAGRLGPSTLVPLALACQLLARVDLLLPPLLDLRTLVSVLVLPAVSGVALSLLALRLDGGRVLLAGATVVVLSPGWNVSTTLCLVALATGSLLKSAAEARGNGGFTRRLRPVGFLLLGLMAVWNFPVGGLSALAGLVLWGERKVGVMAVAMGALLVVAHQNVLGGGLTVQPLAGLMVWLGGVALVPAALLAPRDGRWFIGCGLLLALAGAFAVEGPEALAGGLALAALGLPLRGAEATLQRCWSALVVSSSLLLAAYPWVRARPREDLLVLLGLGGSSILIPLLLMVALTLLLNLLNRGLGDRRIRPAWVFAALLFGVVALSSGPSTVLVDTYQTKMVNSERRGFRQTFPEQSVSTVLVETNLVQGLAFVPGTTIGSIRLRDAEKREIHRWPLKVGIHTGEWAAARPDVAAHPNFKAPRAWLSQLAPDGTFFARRYRAQLHLAEAVNASSFELTLRPHLAPGVQLVVYRVELRP